MKPVQMLDTSTWMRVTKFWSSGQHKQAKCNFFYAIHVLNLFSFSSLPYFETGKSSFLDVLGMQVMLMAESHSLLELLTYFIYVQLLASSRHLVSIPTKWKLAVKFLVRETYTSVKTQRIFKVWSTTCFNKFFLNQFFCLNAVKSSWLFFFLCKLLKWQLLKFPSTFHIGLWVIARCLNMLTVH